MVFATLGYRDVGMSDRWRLLSGIEGVIGFILIGWSTALSGVAVDRADTPRLTSVRLS